MAGRLFRWLAQAIAKSKLREIYAGPGSSEPAHQPVSPPHGHDFIELPNAILYATAASKSRLAGTCKQCCLCSQPDNTLLNSRQLVNKVKGKYLSMEGNKEERIGSSESLV